MQRPGDAADPEQFKEARSSMVRAIESTVRETSFYIDRKALDPRVMSVMGRVERHRFVPPSEQSRAYANQPLPIGHGQTISQSYIVALMTDLVSVAPGDKVLEIGTGSGYQAAVLVEKDSEGGLTARQILPVRFVPLTGDH